MNESFAYLGLRADADERAVKRAYAQRLKQIRPEEDPAGFQTLHEHYRIALEQARQRADAMAATDAPIENAASTSRQSFVAHDPSKPEGSVEKAVTSSFSAEAEATSATMAVETAPPPVFDLEAFLHALLARIGDDDPEKLRDWLQSIDAFWSIAVKNHAGHAALHRLANGQVAIRSELFEVMLAYFDFDNALSGYDHFAITRLRDALQLQYELQGVHRDKLLERMQLEGKFLRSYTRSKFDTLQRPFAMWRAYLNALMPGAPSSMVRFIQTLSYGRPDLLCPPVDPQHLQFWYAAADHSRFMRPRVLLGYLRITALVALAATILCVWTLIVPTSPLKHSEQTLDVLIFFAWTFGALIALWSVWLIWLAALRWQSSPERGRLDLNGWGRLLFIPAIAITAAGVCAYSTHIWLLGAGIAVASGIAAIAVIRLPRRTGRVSGKTQVGGIGWIAFFVLMNMFRTLFPHGSNSGGGYSGAILPDGEVWKMLAFIGIALAVAAGLAWGVDLIRQRHHFYRPSAKGVR